MSVFLTAVIKVTIVGLFILGLFGHADGSVELEGARAAEEKRLQGLRRTRLDLVERWRLAENLVLQAETILALRSAGEGSSDDKAVGMREIDRFAAGLAGRLHCQARLSMREILVDAGEGPSDPPNSACEGPLEFHVGKGAIAWPDAWTEELDGMQRRVDRKLSDLDQELERTDGRVGQLHLIENVYIWASAFFAVFLVVMQTAISLGGLFGSHRNGRP